MDIAEKAENIENLVRELTDSKIIINNPTRAAFLCDNLTVLREEGSVYEGTPELNTDATYAEIAVAYAQRFDHSKPESAEAELNKQLKDYFMSKSSYFAK